MIKDSILSFSVGSKDSIRIQKTMANEIPFAIIFLEGTPVIFFHGTPSVEGMKKIVNKMAKLKPKLLKKATFVSCYGAYAPKWVKEQHLKPIQGELTLEWVEMGDGSVAYFVYE